MKGRLLFHSPFRGKLVELIRGSEVDPACSLGAWRSLADEDRDCLPWVPRMLALES